MHNTPPGIAYVSEALASLNPLSGNTDSSALRPFDSRTLEFVLSLILAIKHESEQVRIRAPTLPHPSQSYASHPFSMPLINPVHPLSIPSLRFSPRSLQSSNAEHDTSCSEQGSPALPPFPSPSPLTTNKQSRSRKKLVWTEDLHDRFVAAVLRLGIKSATPARILHEMRVANLTRAHVSSHLQKYRAAVRAQYSLASFKQLRDYHLPRDLTPAQQRLAAGRHGKHTPSPKSYAE